jgi:16S rRNA processing protein RimM
MPSFLPVGRVAGHRGRNGEVTVRTLGPAAGWTAVRRFRLEGTTGTSEFGVEASRAYRDRLVLKLEGVEDANAASRLRGARVSVKREEAPALPAGLHYVAVLIGLVVIDAQGRELGRVVDVIAAGDADVLRVLPARGPGEEENERDELLVPLAPPFLLEVDEAHGRIVVDLPQELRQLNRP